MTTSAAPPVPTADILVVDDSLESLRLSSEILTRAGYQVRPADGPNVALESALARPPTLILLDVKMPGMDGFEVCRRLKLDERTKDIPVVFLSALQDADDKVQGFEAGGVDFVSKPFQESEVLARVKTHVELSGMRRHLEALVAERTADLTETNDALQAEISERRRAESAMRTSEARFRATFEQAAVGIAHEATNGRFLRLNQRFCDIVGFSHDEMLLRTFRDITHPGDLDIDLERKRQLMAGETASYTLEKRYFRKDGAVVWVTLTTSLVRDGTGEPAYFVVAVTDITPRRLAERDLEDYRRRLTLLASDLALSEERERRRIASDLHDEVGQTLVFARIQIARARQASTEPEVTTTLDDVSETILETIQGTRDLVFDLSSPLLDEFGLAAALAEWLDEQVEKKHGLPASFVNTAPDLALAGDASVILFRNTRELVTNVVKHAQASHVFVNLNRDGASVTVTVQDDGIGFDPQATFDGAAHPGGFGLFSIRERMNNLGGSLEIRSAPGQGCKAVLALPLADA